jgi:hypothetical protein
MWCYFALVVAFAVVWLTDDEPLNKSQGDSHNDIQEKARTGLSDQLGTPSYLTG